MSDEIIKTLSNYISENVIKRDQPLQADELIISSGLIDSFSLMDVVLFIEAKFGVRIEDDEINDETFDSLNQLAELIQKRQ